jgi:chromosome segregation ATPase
MTTHDMSTNEMTTHEMATNDMATHDTTTCEVTNQSMNTMEQATSSELWDEYKTLYNEKQNLSRRMCHMQEHIDNLEAERNSAKTENVQLRAEIIEKNNQIQNYIDRLHSISIELVEMKEKNPTKNFDMHSQLRYVEELNAQLLHSVLQLTNSVEELKKKDVNMNEMLNEAEKKYQSQTERMVRVVSEKHNLEEQLSNSCGDFAEG